MNIQFFRDKLFSIGPDEFEDHALELFRWQAVQNPVYRQYLEALRVDPLRVSGLAEIPFLPVSFFKNHKVLTMEAAASQGLNFFESSGTTGQRRSRHYVDDEAFYLQVCRHAFERAYGSLQDFHIFALLPSYLEREHASLVSMADYFIRESASPLSGFFLKNDQELLDRIAAAQSDGRQVMLLGVTFALLQLAESAQADLHDVIVMETGGMKGRGREMIREELHKTLCRGLGVPAIHAEYGMTELFSQAYAQGEGRFFAPPWMRLMLRDINDPFYFDNHLRYGGINVIDLANVHSCAFIETQDLGRFHQDGSFEVLGRFDNSDTRGCNLMVSL
jgi:phenylacetate-coenzyme A ligase PaaK-like adenylate-forming protein